MLWFGCMTSFYKTTKDVKNKKIALAHYTWLYCFAV